MLIKRESKNVDFGKKMGRKSGKAVMGKCMLVERVLPVKQRYETALKKVINAVMMIQRCCRRLARQVRAKKALKKLNQFVLGYHFD